MAIKIEIFERTGSASSPTDELVTNMNWKSQSVNDSINKYYYFPVRLPDGTLANYSVPKYLYAKISGTYTGAKRVRWRLVGNPDPNRDKGNRVMWNTADAYATPQPIISGGLMTLSNTADTIIIPKLSTSGPDGAPALTPNLAANTTYYTNFLVTQFMVDNSSASVGNSEEIGVYLILDEYE